jgi:hypothetical protein
MIDITDPTPMIIPNIVRNDLRLLATIFLHAKFMVNLVFMKNDYNLIIPYDLGVIASLELATSVAIPTP